MKDKTIHYTVAFTFIFICLLGFNHYMLTQETTQPTAFEKLTAYKDKAASTLHALKKETTPDEAAYIGANLVCSVIGSQLPRVTKLPKNSAYLRYYYLSLLGLGGAAALTMSLSESSKDPAHAQKTFLVKAQEKVTIRNAWLVGSTLLTLYGFKLLPYKTMDEALLLNKVGYKGLALQAVGPKMLKITTEHALPLVKEKMWEPIKQDIINFTPEIQLEDALCVPLPE